ncbi:MAG: MBL fold metallo-hydrolase [Candidatus Lokiarchaeota archaeon]|nr:MBL fold metallo-hydrolase [Candidatus Lokiarchaeota archaeon]
MQAIKLSDGIYWVGANVHTEDLFEGIWPIPHGVALNSYIVKGEKTAVIELVREWGGAALTFIKNLQSIPIELKDIDYIVLNHLEPDHTGFTYLVHSLCPDAEIISTEKGAKLVEAFYGITENVRSVEEGDEINLGKGKSLTFTPIPNVHWPETMVTYETNSNTLFPGDAFGSFGVHQGCIFDDKTSDASKPYWEEETLRYYANIISMFSPMVLKAIDRLKDLEIKTIAPSHGLVWQGKPEVIIKKYKRYANYNADYAEPEICVVWGSMYGNTEVMLNSVLRGISDVGVPVNVHRVPNVDASFILSDAYKSAGLIIGAPTYEYGMFPPMKYILDLFKEKHIWYKKAMYFGSYGWSGGAKKDFDELSDRMKWDIFDPIIFNGYPNEKELRDGEERAAELAKQVKEIPSKIDGEEY